MTQELLRPERITKLTFEHTENRTVYFLSKELQAGLSYESFQMVTDYLSLKQRDWAAFLDCSIKTIQNKKKKNIPFQKRHAEVVVHVFMLYKLGVEILGSLRQLKRWLLETTGCFQLNDEFLPYTFMGREYLRQLLLERAKELGK